MKQIDELTDYLADLSADLEDLPDSTEKTMMIVKANELVFWLEMYKEKQAEEA